jgi:hypothetical protein
MFSGRLVTSKTIRLKRAWHGKSGSLLRRMRGDALDSATPRFASLALRVAANVWLINRSADYRFLLRSMAGSAARAMAARMQVEGSGIWVSVSEKSGTLGLIGTEPSKCNWVKMSMKLYPVGPPPWTSGGAVNVSAGWAGLISPRSD